MRRPCALLVLILLASAAFAADNKPAATAPQTATVQAPTQRQFGPLPQLNDPSQRRLVRPPMQFGPDRRGFIQLGNNTCYKLQKYVFQRDDGSDRMTYLGSTDCTRAARVTTESADDPNPPPTGPSLNKAVMRIRPADPPDKH